VGDEADIGLVDAHPEGDGRNHHHVFGCDERGLVPGAHFGGETGVIGQDGASARAQLFGELVHLRPGRRIDDPRPGLLGEKLGELLGSIVAVANEIADVGAVEPGDDQAFVRNAELGEDIGAGVLVGGRGQGKARDVGKHLQQRAQQAVVGAEVVAPFGYAVRFVDCEQADLGAAQQFAEMRLAGAFGGDIEQVERAITKPLDGLLAVGVGAGQRRRADAVGRR
jgi:hypothetical protein